MSRIPLSELDDIFQRAIALPAAGRAEFLERQCASRPGLLTEVRQMLEAHANAGEFLDGSLQSYLSSDQSGDHIGRWKLIEPIGEGGLGVVYRASCEADGVTLHAAVKILRAGFHKGVFQERFIQERSLLSGLDHPYIARLIDAGADSGNSFLAVEFVDGVSLDRYIEQSNSSVGDRLNIFLRICEAVEYLHSHRIVHGDIKPANVMVKQDSTPKLLDFGTARLIDAGDHESSARLSRLIMTPGYASPEQSAGLGPSVRGDVYSLGCVLRDMLAHITPPADLAAIRDKCLSLSPEDRYDSPRNAAADVKRYLKHYAVLAVDASRRYAMSKFIRRNWAACALAGVAFLSVLTGSLLSWYDARRADLYASRHRSVVAHLVADQAAAPTPEANQRAALSGSIHDVIDHLEAQTPQPLDELAGAWRRLSYMEATRGQTQQSVESIQRSIEYARRNQAENDSPAARADLAESLLYAAYLQNQRGYVGKGGASGAEAIRLIDSLPPQQRGMLEQRPHFLFVLFSVARRMAQSDDVQGGRELLLRGLETARTMSKSVQLRILLDLAGFEKRAQNPERVEYYCREAKSLDLINPRFRSLCEQKRPVDIAEHESELVQKVTLLERRAVHDPESSSTRRQLARLKLQLARTVAASGDKPRAARILEEARASAEPLIEADPQNRRLQLLARHINREFSPPLRGGVAAASKRRPRSETPQTGW